MNRTEEQSGIDPIQQNEKKPAGGFTIPKGFVITPILIGINVLVFALMVVSGVDVFKPTIESLIQWGGNAYTLSVGTGEWWRVITNNYVHVGVMHLLVNMVSLYIIGIQLEPMIGKSRFLAAYITTGIAGSVVSMLWKTNALSAGASGAIFGMFGVFLALITTPLIEKSVRKTILSNIVSFLVINLVIGMMPGIDFAAHLGGLICGMIIGYLYYAVIKMNVKRKIAMSVALAALIALAIIVIGFGMAKPIL
ncbi:rhomboid family intramembrane serine protease [Pseudoflavitalea sp. G-6-1-2]|uniref:rhomboid family intramembrane serine protease n=1 Tax=Pseudoflavitalea sp. G-6-1-2 TaxID=2728841 RepID=UPI001469EB4D|nr:rhomboid family intramembrane serine protease [Pseudoflavitalea sp. G-6-1-2]NML19987.1 rhomboid family intramembrane serine protease [Pseudoflavitalea sp. G-6-1-2]